MTGAQLSARSAEHGTPPEVVELARHALGSIDLDPASSAYWNKHTVRAAKFYDRDQDGLSQHWVGNVFVNPPGADATAGTRSQVRAFWDLLWRTWRAGAIVGAVFHGYSLEQLVQLQSFAFHPLHCPTVIHSKRLCHLKAQDGAPIPGANPTHGSFTSLLPSRDKAIGRSQTTRFVDAASRLGAVVTSSSPVTL